MQQLQGKTALVAGGGRNNGKAIARDFAREGADSILVAREKKAELDQVAHDCEKLGAKVLMMRRRPAHQRSASRERRP